MYGSKGAYSGVDQKKPEESEDIYEESDDEVQPRTALNKPI